MSGKYRRASPVPRMPPPGSPPLCPLCGPWALGRVPPSQTAQLSVQERGAPAARQQSSNAPTLAGHLRDVPSVSSLVHPRLPRVPLQSHVRQLTRGRWQVALARSPCSSTASLALPLCPLVLPLSVQTHTCSHRTIPSLFIGRIAMGAWHRLRSSSYAGIS